MKASQLKYFYLIQTIKIWLRILHTTDYLKTAFNLEFLLISMGLTRIIITPKAIKGSKTN